MGLLTTYAIYKAGQRRQRKKDERRDRIALAETCVNCGRPLGEHLNDIQASCP